MTMMAFSARYQEFLNEHYQFLCYRKGKCLCSIEFGMLSNKQLCLSSNAFVILSYR